MGRAREPWHLDDGMDNRWQTERLREILGHEPYTQETHEREAWLVKTKDAAKRAQADKRLRSVYICKGSSRRAAMSWREIDSGEVLGQCADCDQTVVTYHDTGYALCVEHLKQPKPNPCGECGGRIWDDDYLCLWCREAITE